MEYKVKNEMNGVIICETNWIEKCYRHLGMATEHLDPLAYLNPVVWDSLSNLVAQTVVVQLVDSLSQTGVHSKL